VNFRNIENSLKCAYNGDDDDEWDYCDDEWDYCDDEWDYCDNGCDY
jgi:hypothetical protein